MVSLVEPVSVDAPKHAQQEAKPATETQPEATISSPSPTAAAAAAEIHVYEPHRVDLMTPRQAVPASQRSTASNGAAASAAKDGKVNVHLASTATSPTRKVKGRPSQAPLHAARVKEVARRSASHGPLQRSQRRPPYTTPAPVAANGTAVLSTSTRRVLGPTGEAVTTTTAPTHTNNILLRRPRFVDPLVQTAQANGTTNTAAAAVAAPAAAPTEPARHTRPARPTGSSKLAATVPPISLTSNAAAAAASHAAPYVRPIHYHNPTRTPQRTSVSAESVAADAHHRRRLLNGVHRSPAASQESTAATQATTTQSSDDNSSTSVSAAKEVSEPVKNNDRNNTDHPFSVQPASAESESAAATPERTVPEAAADAVQKHREASKDDGNDQMQPAAAPAEAPAETPAEAAAAKPGPRYTLTTQESQVKVLPATLALHPDKKVIISRPTSNQHLLRMAELKRPSEAYKVSLNSSLQSSALARRSRQPRKVLNVVLTKYPVIRKLADELGWAMETTEEELNEYKFNLCWSDTVLSLIRLVRLSNWQRTNHFPSMYLLCRKGHLGTTLGRLRRKLPSHFAFYPRTWSMRSERLQFTQYMAAVRQRRILKYFILKPNSGCQGRGIVVARDPLTALDEHTLDNYIVQEYVHRPLLLEGKKFDLRVYVLLTSIRHPSIFLFNDGLVRICTEPYETPTEENVKNACKHLTNYAVNKKSADYVFNTDVEHMDVGNKRNFAFLNRWLEASGYSSAELWKQVGTIIVKTILAAQPSIARVYDSCFPTGFNDGYCCFEVLGFDILIDHKMKPWLMEVNHTPSFATETPLDLEIKSKLLTEVWSIIDCKATDYEKDRQRERDEFTKRNMPPWTANHPLYGNQLNHSSVRHGAVDEVGSPVNGSSSTIGNHNDAPEVPAYVQARRQHEDSKLHNFSRIYPSKDEELQLMYDTIQNLAIAESANNRLYYNSTIAAPVPPPTSAVAAGTSAITPFGVRSSNALPLRTRPPSLGPVLTAPRAHSSVSAHNATASQRSPASPVMPAPQRSPASPVTPVTTTAAMAPPNGAPATIAVSSVPLLTIVRDGHPGSSTTSPHAAAASTSIASRTQLPASHESNVSTSLPSVAPSEGNAARAPPLSSASLVEAEGVKRDVSAGTTPKTADKASTQSVRVSSPATNSHSTTAASTPSTATATSKNRQNNGGVAVKPRVAEVHRRAPSKPPAASQNTPAPHEPATKECLGQAATAESTTTTTTGISVSQQKATPTKADGPNNTHHQNGSAVTPPAEAELQKSHSSNSPTARITRTSVGRHKSPSLDAPVNNNNNNTDTPLSSSITKRHSLSMSGSGHDMVDVVTAHPPQKSTDHNGRSMSTHPEPTEEELARLVALQARLDYEAAADPQPDDEDEDYNLTE